LAPTGELCSCNYAARAHGVNTHLWSVQKALEILPHLELIPISEFLLREVEQTWQQVYQLLRLASEGDAARVQMRSCDEAFIEVRCHNTLAWAAAVRKAVQTQTQCTCSIGLGPSQIVAKLAGKACKPDGAKQVSEGDVADFMADLPLASLPQVGRVLLPKLEERDLKLCGDVMATSESQMVHWFASKGKMLWSWAHGEDVAGATIPKQRKMISAEINFGVRPYGKQCVQRLLEQVASQLSERLSGLDLAANQLTLKLKIAVLGWTEPPWKRGGHGVCEDASRSAPLPKPSQDIAALVKSATNLLDTLGPEPTRVRGIGLTARVEPKDVRENTRLRQWLKAGAETCTEQGEPHASSTPRETRIDDQCQLSELQCEIVDVESPAEETYKTATAKGILSQVTCPVCNALLAREDADAHVNGHFDVEPSPPTVRTKATVLEHGPGRPRVPVTESLPEPVSASRPSKRQRQATLDFMGSSCQRAEVAVSPLASKSLDDVEAKCTEPLVFEICDG